MASTVYNEKITNQDFELYKEDGEYYLKVDFDYEDEYGVYKGHINKIKFDLYLKKFEIIKDDIKYGKHGENMNMRAKLYKPSEGYSNLISFDCERDTEGNLFTLELVKEKVYEMTMEEIERKLGHKIKIVSKNEVKEF